MRHIVVTTDEQRASDGVAIRSPRVIHSESINVSDLESDHFQAQLVERIGWAVLDAQEAEAEALR
jgi:hypothetical protein